MDNKIQSIAFVAKKIDDIVVSELQVKHSLKILNAYPRKNLDLKRV